MEKGLGEEKDFKAWPVPAFFFGGGLFLTFFLTLQNKGTPIAHLN